MQLEDILVLKTSKIDQRQCYQTTTPKHMDRSGRAQPTSIGLEQVQVSWVSYKSHVTTLKNFSTLTFDD